MAIYREQIETLPPQPVEAEYFVEDNHNEQSNRLLEQRLTVPLSLSVFVAAMGMLQFGYTVGVLNASSLNIDYFIQEMTDDPNNDDIIMDMFRWRTIMSLFYVGGMLGGVTGCLMANRYGRKFGLQLNGVLGIVAACLMGCSQILKSHESFLIGLFLIGLSCGLSTTLVPMYIAEIAPLYLRGGLGIVNQLAITVGLLLSQVLGGNWSLLLGLAICPSALQLLLLPICPESPRYLLITRKMEEEARCALRRLRASNSVEADIEEMRSEERQAKHSSVLRSPLAVVIGIVMQLGQQMCGMIVVWYNLTAMFWMADLFYEHQLLSTIGTTLLMVVVMLVSMPLIDRIGRRTLYLCGLGGMSVCLIFITIAIKHNSHYSEDMIDWMYYPFLASVLGFVVFYAIGPASIPWMFTAELFSQGPRPTAMAITMLVNWLAGVIMMSVPMYTMMELLDRFIFLPFIVLLALIWIFSYYCVPETKKKTFLEIQVLLRG